MSKLSEKTPDRRIAKTRSALALALFELIQTTDWNEITIQALCNKANVARSSFYAHFNTTTDLLESLMAESFPHHSDLPAVPNQLSSLSWLIDHISQSRPLFSRVVNTASAAPILTRFKVQTKTMMAQELKASGIVVSPTHLDFAVGGIFEVIQTWAKTWKMSKIPNMKIELNQLAKTILRIAP